MSEDQELPHDEAEQPRYLSYQEKLRKERVPRDVTVPLTFDKWVVGTATIDKQGEMTIVLNQTRQGMQLIRLFYEGYLDSLSLNGCLKEAAQVGAPGHRKRRNGATRP